jgi:hypothetical protein
VDFFTDKQCVAWYGRAVKYKEDRMAKNDGNTSSARRDYENMSRDELIELVGGYVDPTTSREELITMAMEVDADETL